MNQNNRKTLRPDHKLKSQCDNYEIIFRYVY